LSWQFRSLNEEGELITRSFENGRDNLLNAVCQAEKAALDVFVIVLEDFVELVEESGLLLHSSHPSKV
jgi:hypothetical protein